MSLGLVSYDDSDESENEDVPETLYGEKITTIPGTSYGEKTIPVPGTSSGEKTVSVQGTSYERNASDKNILSQFDDLKSVSKEGDAEDCKVIHHGQLNERKEESTNDPQKSANFCLPPSKISLLNTDIDIKSLTSSNKKTATVKITIPSLNEVEEESEPPSKKKLKPSQKGSGLFSLLPSPKNCIVPQSVVRKNQSVANQKSSKITKSSKSPTKALNLNKSSLISYEDSGDEDETSGTVDFFSLENKNEEILPAPIDIDILQEVNSIAQTVPPRESGSDSLPKSNLQSSSWPVSSPSASNTFVHQPANHVATSEFMSMSNEDLQLDQDAMQQLCGRRDRLKMQEVNIIDVSGDAIMPDPREWLTKQLTEEQSHVTSHKKKDGPTTQQKRKHQITYLAFQAKENELELKNQWANNRMSRKQTQAKYGF